MALLLRLLPFLLLLIAAILFWRFYFSKTAEMEDKKHLPWYKKSWIWLLISSVVSAIIIAVISVTVDVRTHTQGNYIPAEYKDGELIPGYYE